MKELAEHLGLSPTTVSFVINRAPMADSIPQKTKDQIWAAARQFRYRPNFFARSLRTRRSFTVGVMVPEVSEGYAATVLSGIENHLLQIGYFYFVVSHRHRKDLLQEYAQLFVDRAVDGLIAVDTPWRREFSAPVVTISGHRVNGGVTNIVLNHNSAAEVAIRHLFELGHRKIALIKGQDFSSDTEVRWKAIMEAAKKLGAPIPEKLTVQMEGNSPSPEVGYVATKKLLAKAGSNFTALFAFNDVSAIGAIQALREAGAQVPQDVSVMGFDDIEAAAYQNPRLTTVRQPLRKMGEIAAETLLKRIGQPGIKTPKQVVVEPELIVRETTGPSRVDTSMRAVIAGV
ncbi:MAG TPA: LacI family DNA-binding transcriptional regulator [Terriglobales bacterium]|nr:LacI family DNA-binding transcriptional regulator [Terriglobales bacterium]